MAVMTFSIAHGTKSKDDKDVVSFFNVTYAGKRAENIADDLRKGVRVMVWGKLDQQRWESDGKKHSRVRILASMVAVEKQARESKKAESSKEEEIPF